MHFERFIERTSFGHDITPHAVYKSSTLALKKSINQSQFLMHKLMQKIKHKFPMIKNRIYKIIFICYFIVGCDEQVKLTQKSEAVKEAQKRIIKRFYKEENSFNRLRALLAMNHIKYAYFNNKHLIIMYIYGSYKSDVNLLSVKASFDSLQVFKKILALDSLNVYDIKNVKTSLACINSNNFFISDNYDNSRARYVKSIDFTSDALPDGVTFHYRTFNMPLDSMPKDFYGQPTRFGLTGGTLDKYTIWYYK